MALSDAEIAVAAAEAAAAVVRNRFRGPLDLLPKAGDDFATDADVDAEAAAREVLRSHRPDDAVTGEEGVDSGPRDARRRWLVDPLCGTVNYAAGVPGVAVNVALRDGPTALAAAVVDPLTGELVWCDRDRAYVGRGALTRAQPSASTRLVDVNADPPFPAGSAFRAAALLVDDGFLASFRPRVLSSSLALAWVATGRRAGYVTDGDVSHSVHFAAGIAVCAAAGAVVTDLGGGSWATGDGLVAAADAETSAALLERVRAAGA